MNKIERIECNRFSSNYGDSNSAYGQPLGVKSIVIVTVFSSNGDSRSHELYSGIYCPEILPNIINKVSESYVGKEIIINNNLNTNKFPFVSNSGVIKSVVGAIDSCIIQLYFSSKGIQIVEGLKSLLKNSIRRTKTSPKIKYYGSGGSVAFTPNECLKDANKAIKNNFDGFKMRCGLQSLTNDFERIRSVAELINKENLTHNFYLMIDLIQGTLKPKFNLQKLKTYINFLEEFNIHWLEEPLDPDNISLYEDFNNTYKNNLKICLGESFTCLNEYAAFKNITNYFQIDVTHLGGFPEAIKVLNYMIQYKPETNFSSHLWGSGIAGLLNLALCRASHSINWFEIPLLNFEINIHIFNTLEINYSTISDEEIDFYLGNLNLKNNNKYKFIENSGYRI